MITHLSTDMSSPCLTSVIVSEAVFLHGVTVSLNMLELLFMNTNVMATLAKHIVGDKATNILITKLT